TPPRALRGSSGVRDALELRPDSAPRQRVGVTRPDRARIERGELAYARPSLIGVLVERRVGDAGPALPAGLGVERVDRVADEREAVRLAPEPDHPGRMPGKVHDLEPSDVVALGNSPLDLHRAAVPAPDEPRHRHPGGPSLES